MMKKVLFIILSAMLLAGCSNNENAKKPATSKHTLTLVADTCTINYKLPAQLRGRQDVEVIPQVTAVLEELRVVEGQFVKKGEIMFVLNQTEFASVLDHSKAQVESAEAQVKTMELETSAQKELMDKNIVSEHQYKVTYNNLLAAKAALSEAKASELHAQNDLNHTELRAPYDGVVGSILYRQGALVGPSIQRPITIFSDNSTVVAYTSMNEMQYMRLITLFGSRENFFKNVPSFRLAFPDGSVYAEEGKLETLSGVVDRETGALSIRIAFPNPNYILTSGGSATAVLPVKVEGLVIPKDATYTIQDKTFAYKVEKQDSAYIAKSVEVKVERLNDKEYVVVEGLKDKDAIVIEGVSKMYSGMEITPIDSLQNRKVAVKE